MMFVQSGPFYAKQFNKGDKFQDSLGTYQIEDWVEISRATYALVTCLASPHSERVNCRGYRSLAYLRQACQKL